MTISQFSGRQYEWWMDACNAGHHLCVTMLWEIYANEHMKPYLAQHLKSKIPEDEDTFFFQSYLKSYDIQSRDLPFKFPH